MVERIVSEQLMDQSHISSLGKFAIACSYWRESVVFSPDSKRLAYVAERYYGGWWSGGKKNFVVVDGREGSQYDGIFLPLDGGVVTFDSPGQLHYIALKANGFYLVKERIT